MKKGKRNTEYLHKIVVVILDTGILILLINDPDLSKEARECQEWLYKLLSKGVRIVCPEICYYETRRGLVYLDKKLSKKKGRDTQALEEIENLIEFLPLNKKILIEAADLWAEARINGKGGSKGIDADILIAAHWRIEKKEFPGQYIVVVTKNLKHFKIFDGTDKEIECQLWQNISI